MVYYLAWHYFQIIPKLFLLWRNVTVFPFYYFSVPLHLRTLFSYWKRQKTHPRRGFHFDDLIYVFGFNIVSRTLGAIIRLSVIFFGLFTIPLAFLIGWAILLLAIFFPLISLPFYLSSEKHDFQSAAKLISSSPTLLHLAVRLFSSNQGAFAENRLGFAKKTILKQLRTEKESPPIAAVTSYLGKPLKKITKASLFEAVSAIHPLLQQLLLQYHLTPLDVYQTALWYEKIHQQIDAVLLFNLAKIKKIPGIGYDWNYGYTVIFDQYAKDLTSKPSPYPFLVGREKEIVTCEQTLLKTENNNVLIVGEPGTARHMLVETLAHRIATGNCSAQLTHKRLLNLDMHALTSSKPSILEVKGLASQILEEAEGAGNLIIFVDDFDKYVSDGAGRINLTDIFEKFALSSVGFIGITTPANYHKYIEVNPTLAKLFAKIEIYPPEKETVVNELELAIVPVLERKYKIIITYQALIKTIEDADSYLSSTPFPSKAIELLDEACAVLKTKLKERMLFPKHIDQTISEKLHISVGEIAKNEQVKLVNLETYLHRQVINQNEAINALSASLRRARLNVANPNKPIGTFLFLGPTGVGKTETAKVLAQIYFGTANKLLRFDMSQYQKEEGLERLIGSIKVGNPGELTSKLTDNPFSVLLLDEFEKADKNLLNIFLTLFDEGYLIDHLGRKKSAKNSIIIATSNAGSEFIRESIIRGIKMEELEKSVIDYVLKERIFSPELLNRFDKVVVFTPLSEGNLREVAKLMLTDLNDRLKSKEISIAITESLINQLAYYGNDPQFGARSIRRVISEKIEDSVAKRLLSGSYQKGEAITITL